MAMYHRVGFTAAQSAELWERWKKGEGLKSIGRAFGKPSSCIFAHLRPSGGIMPPVRRRSRLALTMAEREEISRGIVEGQSVRAIARMLARAASTVSREISRNYGVFDEKNLVSRRTTFVIDSKGVVQKVFMAQEALDPAHSLEACALLKEVK